MEDTGAYIFIIMREYEGKKYLAMSYGCEMQEQQLDQSEYTMLAVIQTLIQHAVNFNLIS